LIPAGAIRIFH